MIGTAKSKDYIYQHESIMWTNHSLNLLDCFIRIVPKYLAKHWYIKPSWRAKIESHGTGEWFALTRTLSCIKNNHFVVIGGDVEVDGRQGRD